jgi:hypothetical protein
LWVIFAILDPDPVPATQINADPCGSGSTTLATAVPRGNRAGPDLMEFCNFIRLVIQTLLFEEERKRTTLKKKLEYKTIKKICNSQRFVSVCFDDNSCLYADFQFRCQKDSLYFNSPR